MTSASAFTDPPDLAMLDLSATMRMDGGARRRHDGRAAASLPYGAPLEVGHPSCARSRAVTDSHLSSVGRPDVICPEPGVGQRAGYLAGYGT